MSWSYFKLFNKFKIYVGKNFYCNFIKIGTLVLVIVDKNNSILRHHFKPTLENSRDFKINSSMKK